MSFGFLNPVFFAGLAVLLAPVLIHLVARRETRGRAFPSLMFLRNIPIKRARRRTLRDPWLLLLRALALTLLVLAFANPYLLDDTQPEAAPQPVKQTVIAVDRSYSMRFDERWSRALAAARRAIDDASPGQAALVLFDDVPHTAAAMTGDSAHLRQTLSAARVGHSNTDYARVLAHAAQLFDQRLAGDKTVVLVTDLQSVGLQNNRIPTLAQSIQLRLENVAQEKPGGALLTGVDVLGSDPQSARVNLIAEFDTPNGIAPTAGSLRVDVDGHTADLHAMTDAEIASGAVALGVVPASDHASNVELSIDGDNAGHRYRLTLAQVAPIRVTLLSREDASHSATYLQQALVLASRPQIVAQRAAATALTDATLERSDVLIIDDVAMEDGAVIARIEKFVAAGGGLLVIAGEHPRQGAPLLATSLVPRKLGEERTGTVRLTQLLPHPALATLRVDQLRNAPVWRRRAMQAGNADTVLARYSDGQPAMIERQVQSGTSIVLSTAVGNQWSALALEPGFAPLAIGVIRHLAKRRSGAGASAAIVGTSVDIEEHAALLGAEALLNHLATGRGVLVESPDGTITKVSDAQPAFVPRAAGFYRLHVPGAATRVPLAVNVDPQELQFDSLGAEAFAARVVRTTPRQRTPDPHQLAAEGTLQPTPWWYLLAAVVVLLLSEGLYAARLTRRPENPQTV